MGGRERKIWGYGDKKKVLPSQRGKNWDLGWAETSILHYDGARGRGKQQPRSPCSTQTFQCPPRTARVSAAVRRITIHWNILHDGSFHLLFRISPRSDPAAECLLNPLHALSQAALHTASLCGTFCQSFPSYRWNYWGWERVCDLLDPNSPNSNKSWLNSGFP